EFEVAASGVEIRAERADLQDHVGGGDRGRTIGDDLSALFGKGRVGKSCPLPCPGFDDSLPTLLCQRREQGGNERHASLAGIRLAEDGNFHTLAAAQTPLDRGNVGSEQRRRCRKSAGRLAPFSQKSNAGETARNTAYEAVM